MKELLSNVGAGGSGPAPTVVGGGGTGGAPDAAAEKVEEKKEEEKEESDDDMVRSVPFGSGNFHLTGCLFRASVFSISCLSHVAVPPPGCKCICTHPANFQLLAISSSRIRSITNGGIEDSVGCTWDDYLYKATDRHSGSWLTQRSSWTPSRPTCSSTCPENQRYFQLKLESEIHLRGQRPCRRQ